MAKSMKTGGRSKVTPMPKVPMNPKAQPTRSK